MGLANADVTVVLTLKDRTPFTYRWMRYMNDIRCPYPVLIADGGDDREVESHLRQPGHYPHLRYTYLRYPVDQDYAAYFQKLADVVGQVSTPYVLLADNDDFFFIEHVATFTAFLDAHEDFVSCGGKMIELRLLSPENALVASPSASRYEAAADDRPKAVTADSAVERLCYFMTHVKRDGLWSSWYHVHRTPAMKEAMSLVRQHTFTDPVALETHVCRVLLSIGKSHQFEVPFWVAQRGSSQIMSALNAEGNLIERLVMNNSLSDLHRSVASLAALSEDEKRRVYKAIATYLADYAIALYPARRPKVVPRNDPIDRLYHFSRRLLRPLKRLVWRERIITPAPLRLATLEKYILD